MDLQKYAKLSARSHNGAKTILKLNFDHFRSIVVTIAFTQLRLKLAELQRNWQMCTCDGQVRMSMQIYANLLQEDTCLNGKL